MKKTALCAKSLMLMLAVAAVSCSSGKEEAVPAAATADKAATAAVNIRYIDADSIAAHYTPQIHTDFAKANGIDAKTDEVGNVVLQQTRNLRQKRMSDSNNAGHMDMVCESNKKDFNSHNILPITTIIDGEWGTCRQHYSGADNGSEFCFSWL